MHYSKARPQVKFQKWFSFWREDYCCFLRIGRHQFDWPRRNIR